MLNPSIFISYRITDSLSYANSLSLSLEKAFGEGAAFHDKSSLKPGMNWPQELANKVKEASVVLVLVADAGKWLAEDATTGSRRIDEPEDWVRKEIETALSDHKKLIIPVLIDGARWPAKDALPDSIKPILDIQHKQLRAGNWNDDIQPLIKVISEFLGKGTGSKNTISDLERQGLEQQLKRAIQKRDYLKNARLLENNASAKFSLEHEIDQLETLITDLKSKLQL